MVCANGRILKPELLNSASPDERRLNLRDLVRINRWLGGRFIFRGLLARIAHPSEPLSILDVGAASGDMGAAIRRSHPHTTVTSLDCRISHLEAAAGPRIVADAFHLPFPQKSFDVVFCSLFLHHFDDAEVVELLRTFWARARRAVVVIDLERKPLGYYFLPLTRPLFGWQPITVHDGCVSVEAGFRADELDRLARDAGLPGVRVRRHQPWCRLSLVASAQ
jgi:2-polyprenyl-3-methyl-5-hydroxy-6-metoxy-1,4-benzoquinol methylase